MIRGQIKIESVVRFWAKVETGPNCWEWKAALNDSGYGVFGIGKETDKAHRISWRLFNGEIPAGLFVCHKCDNPKCVNPSHLFLGSNFDNVKDMISKRRNSPPPNMAGWNRKELPEELIKLLGTAPDTVLGKQFGFSKYVLQRVRWESGIPVFIRKKNKKKGG